MFDQASNERDKRSCIHSPIDLLPVQLWFRGLFEMFAYEGNIEEIRLRKVLRDFQDELSAQFEEVRHDGD